MVTYAVTLSDLIEKGGAYAGLAAFFGFAVLSVLAFAQAREIRRLRDWAGRAPERAQELEQRVVQQAEQARRVQATPSRRPGQPATAAAKAVPATAAAKAAPAVTEAPTTAQPAVAADGEAQPGAKPEAKPAPAVTEGEEAAKPAAAEDAAKPAAAEAPAETATSEDTPSEQPVVASAPATDAPAADEEKSEQDAAVPVGAATAATTATPAVTPANGSGDAPPKLPPRATKGPPTPGVRRPAPAAQPLRATEPPSRRPAPAVTQDEPSSGRRTGIIAAGVAAGLILVVIALLAIFTGGDDSTPKQANTTPNEAPAETAQSDPSATPDGKDKEAPANRADTTVAVLNGTTVSGLAGQVDTAVTEAGYTEAQTPTNYTDQARSASVVFYNGSENRTQAIAIGKLLDISDRQPIVDAAAQLAPGADVVIVVGADQTP